MTDPQSLSRLAFERIQEDLAQAQRGEFVPDKEMTEFFASLIEPCAKSNQETSCQ